LLSRAAFRQTSPEFTGWQSKVQPMKAKQFSFTSSLPVVKEGDPAAVCRTPEDAHRLLLDTAQLAQEAFTVLTLNRKYKVIDRHLISLGIADASLVHPREVFRRHFGWGLRHRAESQSPFGGYDAFG
jgi:hypothetical protein